MVPVLASAAPMVSVYAWLPHAGPLTRVLSQAVTVNVEAPIAVGVPPSRPPGVRNSPAGSVPLASL